MSPNRASLLALLLTLTSAAAQAAGPTPTAPYPPYPGAAVQGGPAPVVPQAAAATSASLRRFAITLDGGVGGPTGLMGLTLGYRISPPVEVELGFGLGGTGYQLALLGRIGTPNPPGGAHRFVFGLGPSIGFRSEALGLHIEHDAQTTVGHDDLFFTVWLNADIGWEARFRWGGVLRVVVGAGLRVADNQAALCAAEKGGQPGTSDCNPFEYMPGSTSARLPVLPYLQFSFGWAF